MAGRQKKERNSPFLSRMGELGEKTEDQVLEEEAFSRLDRLEHTDLRGDDDYIKTCKEIDALTKKGSSTQYSTRDKLRAALAYTVTASSKKASELVGVPPHTIRYWKAEAPWWPTAVAYAIEARKEEWDAKFSEIISLSMDHVIDALKNGDARIVKKKVQTGPKEWEEQFEVERVPMSAKDAMMVLAIARDKQAIMRGEPTSIREVKQTDEQMLENMADKIASAVKNSGKVIEGIVIKPGNDDNES